MIKNRGTRKTTASNILLLGSHFLLEKNSLTVPVEPGTTHVDLQSCLRLLSPVRKTPIGERKHYTERSSFHGRTGSAAAACLWPAAGRPRRTHALQRRTDHGRCALAPRIAELLEIELPARPQ